MKTSKLHAKGGRLFVKPLEVLQSEKGKQILNDLKNSKTIREINKHNSEV